MGSTAEAEIGASYTNRKEAIPISTALEEMVNPQPPTPMQVVNTTSVGFTNSTIKQKCSKAIDMPLDPRQKKTRPIYYLLETWKPKYWGLPH